VYPILFFFFMSLGAFASVQQEMELIFMSKVDASGVRLKWVPKDKGLDYHYNLTRQRVLDAGGLGEAVALGAFRMKTRSEVESFLGKEKTEELVPLLWPQSLYPTDFEKLRVLAEEENRRGMVFYLAESRKDLMEILGIIHTDREIPEPGRYVYTLEARLDDSSVATVRTLVDSRVPAPMNIPHAEAVRYAWGTALKWTGYDAYGVFHIYRATGEEGPYERITQRPVGVNYEINEARQRVTPPYFYSDTELEADKVYYYKVAGIDTFGDESPLSPPAFAVRDAARRPAPPAAVSIEALDREAGLSWVSDAPGLRFHVFRGLRPDGAFIRLTDSPLEDTAFKDGNLSYDTDYFYAITALWEDGRESLMSPPAHFPCRDLIPPARPEGIRGFSRPGQIVLEWDSVRDTDLAGYSVFRALDAHAPDWARLTEGPQQGLMFVDTLSKALDKQAFYYRVRAEDMRGNPSEWSDVLEIRLPDVTPPLSPVWEGWEQKGDTLILRWRASKEEDLLGYLLFRGEGNRRMQLTPEPVQAVQFTDGDFREGEKLVYHLVAVDRAGNPSPDSSPLILHTLDKTPPRIQDLILSMEEEQVKVAVLIAPEDFKAMRIERKREGEDVFRTVKAMHPAGIYRDRYVNGDTVYVYRVRVYDGAGNVTESAEKSIRVP
jgi:fibronectin type 3 domain-containing protein